MDSGWVSCINEQELKATLRAENHPVISGGTSDPSQGADHLGDWNHPWASHPGSKHSKERLGMGRRCLSSLLLSPGHPGHHLPYILLMTQLAGCHLLNRFHNHDPQFGNHGLRWASWLAVQKLLLLFFLKPTIPSILRRSPTQVLTRPTPCLVSEIRQDRVRLAWYGWRQKRFLSA